VSDDLDVVTERELVADAAVHAFRYHIPPGEPGVCGECEEESPRLIGGRCAFCRDGRRR